MKIDVLVATVKQSDLELANKMNITGDAVIANQSDLYDYQANVGIKMLTTSTKGVGINRNLGILLSDADICVLADDDMKFVDNYSLIVEQAFNEIPQADVIIFNIDDATGTKHRNNTEIKRLHFYNVLNYGAVRIAFRRWSIISANIYFSLLFGGGCVYSNGEDSLFLMDTIKKGLKVYTYPKSIAELQASDSTWFNGYNDKFFEDKGVLYYNISNVMWKCLCIQDAIRHKKLYKRNPLTVYQLMRKGVNSFKKDKENL